MFRKIENKKAWIRIVEAFIAVVLIAGVIITLYARNVYQSGDEELEKILRSLLEEFERTDSLRKQVLQADVVSSGPGEDSVYEKSQEVEDFFKSRIPASLNYKAKICGPKDICGLTDSIDKNVYSDEVLISANVGVDKGNQISPRKVKLFVWEE